MSSSTNLKKVSSFTSISPALVNGDDVLYYINKSTSQYKSFCITMNDFFSGTNNLSKFYFVNNTLTISSSAVNITGTLTIDGTVVGLDKTMIGLENVDNTADINKNVNSAIKLTTPRTISLSGSITGSANFDGSSSISIDTEYHPNSVTLGTDTNGNYVQSITIGSYLINNGTNGLAGSIPILSVNATVSNLPATIVARDGNSNIAANTANFSIVNSSNVNSSNISANTANFSNVNSFTISANTGYFTSTTPLVVSSNTLINNLNSDYLDGQHGSYYSSANNLTGTIPSSVLGNSTHYIGTTPITLNRSSSIQTLTGISVDGNANTATFAYTANTATTASFAYNANTSTTATTATNWIGIPSGTYMLFLQSNAPTGWTKITYFDDYALRVVSGTAGTGGSVAFSSVFSSSVSITGSVANTTLTTSQMPSHSHSVSDPSHAHTYYAAITPGRTSGTTDDRTSIPGTGTTSYAGTGVTLYANGGGEAHSHSLSINSPNLAIKYIDSIICQKN